MKSAFLFLLSFLVITQSFCQKLYFRASGGYSFASSPNPPLTINGFPQNGYTNAINLQDGVVVLKKGSLGSGTQIGLGVGAWFNESVGLDLGFITGVRTKRYTVTSFQSNRPYESTIYAPNPSFVTISVALKSDDFIKNFSVNAGFILPVSKKVFVENESVLTQQQTERSFTKIDVKTRYNVGIYAAANYDRKVSKHLGISASLALNAISFRAIESNLVVSTINGEDVMNSIPEENKKIKYEEGVGGVKKEPGDYITTDAYRIPFGTLTAKIGVTYLL